MHVLIFICRWETKSLQTILSYILTSLSNDMRFGKILSHWFFNVSNYRYWGVLQTLNYIQIEPDNVKLFVDSMYLQKYKSYITKSRSRLFLLLLWDFMKHLLVWFGMNPLVSTRIQPIIPSTRKLSLLLQKQ